LGERLRKVLEPAWGERIRASCGLKHLLGDHRHDRQGEPLKQWVAAGL
jgi:hypothetical protein